jgi:hypothetical protein
VPGGGGLWARGASCGAIVRGGYAPGMGWTPTQTVTAVAGGLQVVGVLVVVIEAVRLRQLFKVTSHSLAFRVAEFVRQRWPWRRSQTKETSVTIDSTSSFSGNLTMKVSRPSGLEERVSRLERDIDERNERRENDQRQAAERHAEVVTRQAATDARLTDALGEQRKTLEDATSARAPMHLWGVMALLTGLGLSIAPEAIVTAWQWEPEWLRAVTVVAIVVLPTFAKGT